MHPENDDVRCRAVIDIDSHAASWIDGRACRTTLSARRRLALGTCLAIVSARSDRDREAGCQLLSLVAGLLARQPVRTPAEAAAALERSLGEAADASFMGAVPLKDWGAGALLVLPRWGIASFALLGEAALWRRERGGALTEIARRGIAQDPPRRPILEAPMLVFAPGDRLLLATGDAAATATGPLATSIGGTAQLRSLGAGLARAGRIPQAQTNASVLAVAAPVVALAPMRSGTSSVGADVPSPAAFAG